MLINNAFHRRFIHTRQMINQSGFECDIYIYLYKYKSTDSCRLGL